MTFRCFIPARTETLLSILRLGRLPERRPRWLAGMSAFLHPRTAVAHAHAPISQTYLIEIDFPEEAYAKLKCEKIHLKDDDVEIIDLDVIEYHWIVCIHAYSSESRRHGLNLLNKECRAAIRITPSYFALPRGELSLREFELPDKVQLVKCVTFKEGDLLRSDAQTLVNTVNCVGVMGKGIALAFKKQYPAMFRDYRARCARGEVKLGEPFLYRVSDSRQIINFPTKNHWRNRSYIKDVREGLTYLLAHLKVWNVHSMAIPPLGCGNGGLSWVEVRAVMLEQLSRVHVPVEIYKPFKQVRKKSTPLQTKRKVVKQPAAFFKRRRLDRPRSSMAGQASTETTLSDVKPRVTAQ